MSRLLRLVSLVPLLAVLLATGCGGGDEGAAPLEARVEDFRLLREEDGTQVVRGVLVNASERSIGGAQIEVHLYAGGEEPVETMRVEVQNVGPGEEQPFREVVDTAQELSGARVGQILLF